MSKAVASPGLASLQAFGASLTAAGPILAATLLPTLALWLGCLAAMPSDDQREENRVWKTTR